MNIKTRVKSIELSTASDRVGIVVDIPDSDRQDIKQRLERGAPVYVLIKSRSVRLAIEKIWEGVSELGESEFMDSSDREAAFYELRGALRTVGNHARAKGMMA